MTIRSKLQFSTFIQVLLVLVVGFILTITFRQIGATNEQSVAMARINEAISELRFITVENLLHHEDRSFQQWQSKHQEISAALATIPAMDSEKEAIRAEMQKQQFEIKVT